jgi:hypothetical protein
MAQGRFKIDVSINDTSVADSGDLSSRGQGVPSFRTFAVGSQSLVLRDGETGQLTTVADPVSGEVVRVDVTLNVLK